MAYIQPPAALALLAVAKPTETSRVAHHHCLWCVDIQSCYGRDKAKGGKHRPDHKLRH